MLTGHLHNADLKLSLLDCSDDLSVGWPDLVIHFYKAPAHDPRPIDNECGWVRDVQPIARIEKTVPVDDLMISIFEIGYLSLAGLCLELGQKFLCALRTVDADG